MSKRNQAGLGAIDWMTFSLFLSLIGVGWLMIYVVGHGYEGYPTSRVEFLTNTEVGKQTVFIGIAGILGLFTLIIDWKFWRTFAYLIYALSLLALVAVLIFGKEINGATSWFMLPGGFTLQPSEFAKFGACLAMAAFLSNYGTSLRNRKSQLTAIGLMTAPIFLILLQSDLGSAIVFTSFFIVMYREGMPSTPYILGLALLTILILTLATNPDFVIIGLLLFGMLILILNFKENRQRLYALGGLLGLIAASIYAIMNGFYFYTLITNITIAAGLAVKVWIERQERIALLTIGSMAVASFLVLSTNFVFEKLKPHHRTRVNVWLNLEECDPRGSAYNLIQARNAISSGGLQGKGYLNGHITKSNFVPEQSTDFIFSVIGEEQGFIGCFAIISLFALLIWRIIYIGERQRSNFSRQNAYGVAGIFFVHFLVNIGMAMGLMPVVGIPLPFISYGGSSLLGFTLLIGVLLKLDSHRYSV